MSKKKDPTRRILDLYADLSMSQRDLVKGMLHGFDIGATPDLHREARNFRRKPAQTATQAVQKVNVE